MDWLAVFRTGVVLLAGGGPAMDDTAVWGSAGNGSAAGNWSSSGSGSDGSESWSGVTSQDVGSLGSGSNAVDSLPWTYDQQYLLFLSTRVSATLSMVGASFIILSFILMRSLRKSFSLRVVCYLSCCDLMVSIAYWINYIPWENEFSSSPWCRAQSVMLQFFGVAATLWTMCLAHNLYVVVVKVDLQSSRFEIRYHVIVWVVSLVLAGCVYGSYGPAGIWCWITGTKNMLRMTFYIPILAAQALCIFIFVKGRRTMAKNKVGSLLTSTLSSREKILQRRLLAMVMLYTICMLPGLLNRILEFSGYKLYPLFVAQAVCAPLTGAADAVVFGFNARLRDTLCCRKARTGTSRSGSDHPDNDRALTQSLIHAATLRSAVSGPDSFKALPPMSDGGSSMPNSLSSTTLYTSPSSVQTSLYTSPTGSLYAGSARGPHAAPYASPRSIFNTAASSRASVGGKVTHYDAFSSFNGLDDP